LVLPGWWATTVQVPVARSVIVAPFVPPEVHTAGVVVVKVTVKPEDAVALTVTGDWDNFRFARGLKVMVWLACAAVTVRTTFAAAV